MTTINDAEIASLKTSFDQALDEVRDPNGQLGQPDNRQKLQLYAFYKQALEGDVVGECPSLMHMIERSKWNAWNAIKGMSTSDAMRKYIAVVAELKEVN